MELIIWVLVFFVVFSLLCSVLGAVIGAAADAYYGRKMRSRQRQNDAKFRDARH